jgi:hypothetical protein
MLLESSWNIYNIIFVYYACQYFLLYTWLNLAKFNFCKEIYTTYFETEGVVFGAISMRRHTSLIFHANIICNLTISLTGATVHAPDTLVLLNHTNSLIRFLSRHNWELLFHQLQCTKRFILALESLFYCSVPFFNK